MTEKLNKIKANIRECALYYRDVSGLPPEEIMRDILDSIAQDAYTQQDELENLLLGSYGESDMTFIYREASNFANSVIEQLYNA